MEVYKETEQQHHLRDIIETCRDPDLEPNLEALVSNHREQGLEDLSQN